MPKVTDLNFWMEDELKVMLDLIIGKLNKGHQAVVLVDGRTGTGKTNMAKEISYYVSYTMQRQYTLDNVFFYGRDIFATAQSKKKQMCHWDEATLGGKAIDWRDKDQQKLLTLLEIGRLNNNFYALCIPRFYRLNQGIIDHASCLINTYERRTSKGNQRGHFSAYYKDDLDQLYEDWSRRKEKNYQKRESFHGTFPDFKDKVFSEEDYEKRKSDAILNFDKEVPKEQKVDGEYKQKLWDIRIKLATMNYPIKSKTELAKNLGIDRSRVIEWASKRAGGHGLIFMGGGMDDAQIEQEAIEPPNLLQPTSNNKAIEEPKKNIDPVEDFLIN